MIRLYEESNDDVARNSVSGDSGSMGVHRYLVGAVQSELREGHVSEKKEPEFRKVRAIDVRPYEWGIWCTVKGHPKPFVNTIESRSWSDDGQAIWFMLATHNFQRATPDEELDLVPLIRPEYAPPDDQVEFLAKRPVPTVQCAACAGKGRVPA